MRTAAEIESEFIKLNIPFDAVEFYNHPNFLKAEQNKPELLESYAEYIAVRSFDDAYIARSRKIVTRVVRYFRQELAKDGKQGACLDVAQALMKVLERLGIWCYIIGGSLTVEFPPVSNLKTRYWAHFFDADGNPNVAGHAWVSAPPFKVIDITIGQQPNTNEVREHLPDMVIAEEVEPVKGVSIEDMLDRDLEAQMRRQGIRIPTIHELMADRRDVAQMLTKFRPFAVRHGDTLLKYFPCRTGALSDRFEDAKAHCFSGRTVPELFHDLICEIGSEIEAGA